MELAIQAAGACVVCALLAVVVRRGSPETALLLAVAAAVVVLLAVGQALEEVIGFLAELGERSGISPELFVPLYKAVGIALVVRVGGYSEYFTRLSEELKQKILARTMY